MNWQKFVSFNNWNQSLSLSDVKNLFALYFMNLVLFKDLLVGNEKCFS